MNVMLIVVFLFFKWLNKNMLVVVVLDYHFVHNMFSKHTMGGGLCGHTSVVWWCGRCCECVSSRATDAFFRDFDWFIFCVVRDDSFFKYRET